MKIGEVAARAGVPAKTIRFWEQQGLLADPARTPAGYRDYSTEVVDRLTFIRHAQSAGFRLDQVRQVLDIGDSGDAPCQHVSHLIDERLAQVEERLAELEETRDKLRVLARRAAVQDPADCKGYCSIITTRPPRPRAASRPVG
jgi:MerR family copper efflux transcriptional regulator